jgi:hypothetical protein
VAERFPKVAAIAPAIVWGENNDWLKTTKKTTKGFV